MPSDDIDPPRDGAARGAAWRRLRDGAARVVLYGLHAPPASWMWAPLLPIAVPLSLRLRERSRVAWLAVALPYYAFVLGLAVALHGQFPHVPVEDGLFVLLGLGAALALPLRGARPWRRALLLAVVLGALMVGAPPLVLGVGPRLVLAALAAGGTLALVAVLGPRVRAEVSPLALGVALVGTGLWGRHVAFYNLAEVTRPELHPAVTRIELPPPPAAGTRWRFATAYVALDPPRFLVESCDPSRLVLGRLRGVHLLERGPGDGGFAATASLPVGGNNDVVRDCGRGTLLAGHVDLDSEDDHEIVEIDLERFEVLRRVGYCAARGPDTVRVDPPRDRLYVFDDTGAIHSVALSSFRCAERLPGTFIRDFAVDAADGSLLVWDEGAVVRLAPFTGRELARLEIPSPRALPHPVHFHFGRVLLDPDGERLWLADHANGVLYAIDAARLEIVGQRRMRRGIRHLVVDAARDRLYVANQLTGRLTVLDRSSLEPLGSIAIGRRSGVLSLSADGERIVLVSAAGAFSLDLERLDTEGASS